MRYENDCIGMTGMLDLHFWTLALSVGIFWVMKEYHVNPVLGLLAAVRGNQIDSSVSDDLG